MSLHEALRDESYYKISHENNRLFIHARKLDTVYYKNPPKATKPPYVKLLFHLDHHFFPNDDDLTRYHHRHLGGFKLSSARLHSFSQPLRVFDSGDKQPATKAFKAMLARLRLPFELSDSIKSGELYWGNGVGLAGNDPVSGLDALVGRLSEAGVSLVREAMEAVRLCGAAKSVGIKVRVMKRTVVDSEWFMSMEALDRSERGLEPYGEGEDGFDSDDNDSEWVRGMDEALDESECYGHDSEDDDEENDFFCESEEEYIVPEEEDEDEGEGEGDREEEPRFLTKREARELVEKLRYNGGKSDDDDDDDLECSICLREFEASSGAAVTRLNCFHKYHKTCIVSWLRKAQNCPLCRSELVKKDLN